MLRGLDDSQCGEICRALQSVIGYLVHILGLLADAVGMGVYLSECNYVAFPTRCPLPCFDHVDGPSSQTVHLQEEVSMVGRVTVQAVGR